eukprot:10397802-Heterocapsa_arctica.AAC.1
MVLGLPLGHELLALRVVEDVCTAVVAALLPRAVCGQVVPPEEVSAAHEEKAEAVLCLPRGRNELSLLAADGVGPFHEKDAP